jgi:hypothetical protein
MQISHSQKYQWNKTLGGPHLFLMEEFRRLWRGSDGWRGLDTTDTDYARACQVKTWLESRVTQNRHWFCRGTGVIAWIAKSNCDGGFLIQWIGIDNEDDIKPALQSRDLAGVLGGPRAQKIEFLNRTVGRYASLLFCCLATNCGVTIKSCCSSPAIIGCEQVISIQYRLKWQYARL